MTSTLPSSAPSDLRPYQRAAIEAVLAARRAGKRRMLVRLPTGAGKTVIFSHLAQLARRQVLVLAHREELLDAGPRQARSARWQAPRVVAIERGAQRAPPDAKVLVCSIRSLHEERLAQVLRGRDVGLIIYDECHHAAAEDNLRVLRQLGVFERRLHGHAARLHRHDGARRRQGPRQVFERIVYSRTLPELIDDGFLAPLRGYRIATTADLRQLLRRRPRLRRGGARRGRRHRGAQRARRAVDPGARARSPHDRVLRDGEPRAQPGRAR